MRAHINAFHYVQIKQFHIAALNCQIYIIFLKMKSFIAKWVYSIVNLRYLGFRGYRGTNEHFNSFDHSFKNITLYIMRNVLEGAILYYTMAPLKM